MKIKEWKSQQREKDTLRLVALALNPVRNGLHPPDIKQVPRDAQRVADEQAWIASSSATKALIETALRLAALSMGVITGDETEEKDIGSKPKYDESPAVQNGWTKFLAATDEEQYAIMANPGDEE